MLRLGLVALSLVTLAACVVSDDEVGGSDESWDFGDVSAVLVEVGNGSIDVRPTDGQASVEWDGGGFGDAASPDIDVRDGLVHVDADSGAGGGGEIVVWLPEGVGIGAWIDYGEITIDIEAPSDVVACAVAGDVRLDVPAGDWDLQVDAPLGDTRIEGINDDPSSSFHIRSSVAAGSLRITGR